ncbi:addiction module killer protein [Burkholderia cepacia]|uniref:Addiction module killer protein n=1 Tax=Burkholderia cepacia TaxID=292 RepID=A0A1B4PY12_BURCE|nr:type II toxin-antitoxin system RelE/ParE family toxin [Burkholderia cepacia]AOK18823.1 addiction module killer protein [Burkholderia cepacia]
MPPVVELLRYRCDDGHEPFTEWLLAVRDKLAQARIRERLRRVQTGNFGDCEPVGEGVIELRVHVGAGYRVYFGRYGGALVLLLSGGDKDSQTADIRYANALWHEWKRRQT